MPSIPDAFPATQAEILHSGAARVLENVLEVIRERRGLDFTDYRRGTLERRLANRMVAAHVVSADAYLALLQQTEDEVDRLAANLTIKVSRFYRNSGVFEALHERDIPALRARYADDPLRVWSAGCATGQEAWTLATILAEGDCVTATDIDETALSLAKRGQYLSDSLIEAPMHLSNGAFVPAAGEAGILTVTEALRRRVTFVRHDLAAGTGSPAPLRYHLICCRNVLIYFGRRLQQQTFNLLAASLLPGGILCLGEAEWPGDIAHLLEIVDRRRKIFRRKDTMENGS